MYKMKNRSYRQIELHKNEDKTSEQAMGVMRSGPFGLHGWICVDRRQGS